MQAIIMAAGRGSRLGELTKDQPKAFLRIRGISMLDYNIALLHANHIRDIIVVTGYQNERFEEHLKDVQGIRCVYNPFYEQMNVLGSFFMAQEYLTESDTVYLHADTLCAPELFSEMLQTNGDMVLPVEFKLCDEEAMKVTTKNGEIVEISKEIPCDRGEGEFIGIAAIRGYMISSLRKVTKRLMKDKKFASYFEAAIQELIFGEQYRIVAMDTRKRFWGEVDFLEDYQYVSEHLPDELFQIAKEELR